MTDVDLVKENIQLKLQIENLSQDLIKLKEIQKELDESNQRFDDVIHSALDAILLIDGDKCHGQNVEVSKQRRLFNVPSFQVIPPVADGWKTILRKGRRNDENGLPKWISSF